MAGSAIIGALRVVLGADTAAFESSLNKAKGTANSFASSVTKIAAGIGLERGLERVVEGIVHGFKEAIKSADDMGKAAQKVGLPVEELTKLKFAADLSDVSMEALSAGLGKLSKNMAAVASGSKEQKEHFDALGITVTNADGSLKSVSAVFGELSGKFSGASDGAAKTAAALNLLGKGGKDLIPLLNEGKDGIEELTKTAERMGLVISKETSDQSQRFNDNLKLLDLSAKGLSNTVMAAVLPALVRLSDQFVVTAKDGEVMRSIAQQVVEQFKNSVTAVFALIEGYKILSAVGAVAGDILSPFKNAGKLFADVKNLLDVLASSGASFAGIKDKVDALFAAITVEGKKTKDLTVANTKAIDDFLDSQKKSVASQQAELLTVGMAAGAKENLKLQLQGLVVAQQASIPITEALRLKLAEAGFAAEQMALKLQGAQLVQQALTPGEQFRIEMENNKLALLAFGATAEQIAAVQQKTAEKYSASWDIAGASIAGSFSKIAGAFGKENKAMATAAKAFGIVQSTISMFTGAAKALELPWPANIAAMAAVLAQGATLIANITSTSVPSAAKGGSFMVPGGVSGTDNMMVPFNLASGERVDITPANEVAAGGGGGRGGDRTVTFEIDPRSFLGKHMRDFLEMAIEYQRDGYELALKPA